MPGAQPARGGRDERHAAVKFLLEPRWIVPVEPAGIVLEGHALAVKDGRIEAIRPSGAFDASYERIELPDHVLIPGLVNAHTHAAMSLMRGLSDDLPLMRWLEDHIWPAERQHVSSELVRDGTLLACAEMLRGGITCFNEMYFFPEAALEAASAAGMRVSLGLIVIDFPTAYASDPADYLRKGLALRDRQGEQPRVSFCFAPHAPYTVSDATFRQVATLSAELDLPVHLHLHETEEEIARSVSEHGVRPIERMRRLGIIGPSLIAVHAVHLEKIEIELLANEACSMAHCPSSNLKLASGFAPVEALRKAGVNVCIGTDGAASNNRLDMLQEMRTTALLAKAVARDAEAMPAHAALRAATLGGAQALGIGALTGSLEPGKAADLTAVRLSGPELAPCYDPVSHLVYAAGREHVSHVWVDGEPRVHEGQLVGAAFGGLESRWLLWQNSLKSHADSS